MITGEIWWGRLVNSVIFIDKVKDVLMDDKSVIMNFSHDIPWIDILTYTLEQHLAFMTDERSFEVHDVSEISETPGEYLLRRFCNEAERKRYWPNKHKSYERFLATNDNTTLNRRICCIVGIDASNAEAWLRSVTEYLENRDSDTRGVFILVVKNFRTNESGMLGNINYSDYVTEYDRLMLCLTLLSSEKCSSMQKQYVSEIATNIAGDNVETAGLLASSGMALADDPFDTAFKVLKDNNISVDDLKERVEYAVWKAQIKIVFPRLEELRREIIQKYYDDIQECLPVKSNFGECIEKASEIEIGQLYYISSHHAFLDKSDYEKIVNMREARNLLAHRDVLDRRQLNKLLS